MHSPSASFLAPLALPVLLYSALQAQMDEVRKAQNRIKSEIDSRVHQVGW